MIQNGSLLFSFSALSGQLEEEAIFPLTVQKEGKEGKGVAVCIHGIFFNGLHKTQVDLRFNTYCKLGYSVAT